MWLIFYHIVFLKAAIDFRMAAADFGGKLSKTLAFLAWLGCMDQLLGRSQVDSYSDLATKKSANSQAFLWNFVRKKHQGANKKTRKNTSVMSFKSWMSWPTMANHGQFEWVGGGYLTAADCPDNDPVAFQLHGSQDGV